MGFLVKHKMKLFVTVILALLTVSYYHANQGPKHIEVTQQFNIKPEWRNRLIAQVCLPGTHNSYNTGFKNTNVDISIKDQIDLGIRFFEIDVYDDRDGLRVYHGTPWTGSWDFNEIMNTLAEGLSRYPNEIFFLKIERHADQQKVEDGITHILGEYVYQGKEGEVPTVQQLIDSGKRLITTGGAGSINAPLTYRGTKVGNRGSLDLLWEPYVYRGDERTIEPDAGLRLTAVVLDKFGRGNRDFSKTINTPSYLRKLAMRTWRLNGRIPGQLIIDFPSYGNVFEIANHLNGLDRFFGKVEMDSSILFEDGDIEWDCTYTGGEYEEEITTSKLSQVFDLGIAKGEKVLLRPKSEKFSITPELVEWQNLSNQDTIVTFTLKERIINN